MLPALIKTLPAVRTAMQPPQVPPQRDERVRRVFLYGAGGLLLAGGLFLLGRSAYRTVVSTIEQRKSLDDNSPATYAKAIKMAFDNDGWWGTDEGKLRDALRQVPSKDAFKKTITSYQKLYNRSLLKDMEEELTSAEYQEMLYIIAAKPEKTGSNTNPAYLYSAWSKRLKAAFDNSNFFSGVDKDAVRSVFLEIPTQAAFIGVASAYRSEFGKTLSDDLRSKLGTTTNTEFMRIITSKPLR